MRDVGEAGSMRARVLALIGELAVHATGVGFLLMRTTRRGDRWMRLRRPSPPSFARRHGKRKRAKRLRTVTPVVPGPPDLVTSCFSLASAPEATGAGVSTTLCTTRHAATARAARPRTIGVSLGESALREVLHRRHELLVVYLSPALLDPRECDVDLCRRHQPVLDLGTWHMRRGAAREGSHQQRPRRTAPWEIQYAPHITCAPRARPRRGRCVARASRPPREVLTHTSSQARRQCTPPPLTHLGLAAELAELGTSHGTAIAPVAEGAKRQESLAKVVVSHGCA